MLLSDGTWVDPDDVTLQMLLDQDLVGVGNASCKLVGAPVVANTEFQFDARECNLAPRPTPFDTVVGGNLVSDTFCGNAVCKGNLKWENYCLAEGLRGTGFCGFCRRS